jgi:hypothetical protein
MTKVRLEVIEQRQLALEALPEYRAQEVTKVQAVRMLLTQIRATRAKGYSLEAIGKVLSERGIPITAAALRAYVSETKGRATRKKKNRRTGGAKLPQDTPKEGPKAQKTARMQQSTRTIQGASVVGATAAIDVDAGWGSGAATPAVGRKSVSVVRNDSEDI